MISNDYYFENWSVVEKNDSKKDASPYVDIKVTNNENSYTTIFTLLNDSPDLLIKPVTKLKPGVFSASPTYYSTGVSFFKAVTLAFTQPMKNADLENWTHVKITDKNGNSIKENFSIPELSEDGKILTIVPIASKIRNLLTNVQTFEIKVTVDGGLNDAENSPFVTKPFTHTYVINKPVDDAPPVLTEINISKEILNLETREKSLIPINQNGFDENWSFDELENHHTNGSIFINCKGTDNSSGIKALKVTETLIKKADGSDGGGTSFTASYGNIIEKTDTYFEADTFEYELHSNNGIIKLDFEFAGYNEEVSEKKTFYVLKDSREPSIGVFEFNTNSYINNFLNSNNGSGVQGIDSFTCQLYFSSFYKDLYEPVYLNVTYWDEGDEGNVKNFVTNQKCEANDLNGFKSQMYDLNNNGTKLFRNFKNDTIIKVIAETKYGNTSEKIYTIDKAVKFFIKNIEEEQFLGASFNYLTGAKVTFDSLTPSSFPDYYYQYKENSGDSYESELKKAKLSSNKISLLPGFYKFYFYFKSNGNFFVFSDDTIEFQVTDEGKVKSLKNNGSVTVNDSDWPKISKVNITDCGPNSGVCNVKYDYSFAGNPEYDFRVKLIIKTKTGNQEIVTGNIDETFTLESGYSTETGYTVSSIYEPYFLCFDKSGILLADSRDKNIDYSEYIIDIRDVHNLPLDVGFFSLTGSYESSPVNAVFEVLSFFDNPDVEQKIIYYVVKNKESLTTMIYSENLIKELPEYTFKPGSDFIVAAKKTSVPVEVPENGYYTIFAKVKDKYGNYGIKNGFFSSYVGGELDLSKISVDSNIITLPDEKAYGSYCYYYEDGEWKQDDGVKSAQTENNKFTVTANDGFKNKFVKLVSYSDAGRRTGATGPFRNYNKTVYLYPDYYLSNLKIRNKGMMELKNGYQLFIDQPAFVRVLYSKTNWGDDADLWGTRGFETDCHVENETFTYTPNIKEVPSGYYYCSVVHFADGTSAMGTVYQKP